MRSVWRFAGAVLLAGCWSFLDGFSVERSPVAAWTAAFAGLACLAAGGRGGRLGGRLGRPLVWALATALVVSALLAALQPILILLGARLHRIPGAAAVAAPALELLGLSAGAEASGNVLIDTAAGARPVAITWELLGMTALLRLATAIIVLGGWRRAPRNLAVLASYASARCVCLLALLAGGAAMSIAYEPGIVVASFLPIALLMTDARPSRHARPAPDARPAVIARPLGYALLGVALLALAGACAGFALGYRDPGRRKAGRVLIDESRSQWEWTDVPFDHSLYGQRSVYNYSLWKDWIDLHFVTRIIGHPPTALDLGGADVLIVKTPTSPYDPATIDRIERFVSEGGGLYLIGDHTNLFGMATVLNAIARPYGITFESDDTFPLDPAVFDVFRPQGVAVHPVLRGIDVYPFETSCTLGLPWSGEALITGRRLGAEPIDYGQVNFFGDIHLDPSEMFGLFVQAAAVVHGRGRVVAFADSTNFSNFSMLWPGRRELTLNVIDWLDRDKGAGQRILRVAALVAGASAAAAACRLLGARGARALAPALWLAVGMAALVARQTSVAASSSFGSVPARRPYRTAGFDTGISSFRLDAASPILTLGEALPWNRFNAFFINAARSGVWPVLTDLRGGLETHDVLILVNPTRRPSAEQIKTLGGFLERGGRLLVLDSILNTASTAALITERFGLSATGALKRLGSRDGPVVPALEADAPGGAHRLVTRGGAVVVWRDVGAGRLVLAGDAALFSDRGFGGVYTTPTEDQKAVYDGQEDLLNVLLARRPETPG